MIPMSSHTTTTNISSENQLLSSLSPLSYEDVSDIIEYAPIFVKYAIKNTKTPPDTIISGLPPSFKPKFSEFQNVLQQFANNVIIVPQSVGYSPISSKKIFRKKLEVLMNNNKDVKKIIISIDKDIFDYIFLHQININKSIRSCIYKIAYNIAHNKNDKSSNKIKQKIENLIKANRIYDYNISIFHSDEQTPINNSQQNEIQYAQTKSQLQTETKPHTLNPIQPTHETQNITQNLEQSKTIETTQKENQNTNSNPDNLNTKNSLLNF